MRNGLQTATSSQVNIGCFSLDTPIAPKVKALNRDLGAGKLFGGGVVPENEREDTQNN